MTFPDTTFVDKTTVIESNWLNAVNDAIKDGAASFEYIPPFTESIPTTVGTKLSEIVSVKDFGAVGDGVTDDTNAIQKALVYAYNLATETGWKVSTARVYFPYGKYRIAQPNTLFAGLSFGSFNITGDGKNGVTQIIYDVPEASSTDYLIYNNNLFGFTRFSDISFICANEITNQNFMYYMSSGTAQSFTFDNCYFKGFSQLFNVQGSANASENTFINCKFNNFSDCAFRFNNDQAVNWRFFACDAEVFSGTLFEYMKGLQVLWSQGSIIPTASTARIIKVPLSADPNSFGGGNQPNVIFHGTRFEMREGALMTEKLQEQSFFAIVFDSCGMGGYNIPDPNTYKVLKWNGSGKIAFSFCYGFFGKYRFDYSTSGASANVMYVSIDGGDASKELVFSSTYTIVGPSTQNVARAPLFDVRNCNPQINGRYRVTDAELISPNGANVIKERHGISFSAQANVINVCVPGRTEVLYIPPTRVIKAELFPVIESGYGSATATITIKNAAETITLGSFTWSIGSPSQTKFEVDCNYFVDSVAGDYLKVIFSHTAGDSTLGVFRGQLYLTY